MPTPEQVRTAAEAYVNGYVKGPAYREDFASIWAEDARQIDPVGTPPHVGRDACVAFFDGVFENFERLDMEIRELYVCGDEAALAFTITGYKPGGGGVAFDGIDVFRVSDDGKILEVKGYGDPSNARPFD